MTTDKIKLVVKFYEKRFKKEGILPQRMSTDQFFSSKKEMLSHAYYLLSESVIDLADKPEKVGKTGRHLASAQTLLWVARWYTLEDLMNHNKPHGELK